jgi:hypothetical protein
MVTSWFPPWATAEQPDVPGTDHVWPMYPTRLGDHNLEGRLSLIANIDTVLTNLDMAVGEI